MSCSICPICSEPKITGFLSKGGRDLVICNNCRHVFWSVMPAPQILASYYNSQYTESHGQAVVQQEHRAYYRSHISELAKVLKIPVSDLSIADVGCSYPVFLEEAVGAGASRVIGVDWSPEAKAYGAARGIPVLTPDELIAAVPDESLDVLRYSHTLEHLIDPVGTLKSQVRKVRPGGLVYITQPSIPVFRSAPAVADIHDSVWPTHLHFFSPLSLFCLSQAAGLNVERVFTVTDPEIAHQRYSAGVDLAYARDRLSALAKKGEATRGELNNYPYYIGFNSAIYLRRPAVGEGLVNDVVAMLRRRLGRRVPW